MKLISLNIENNLHYETVLPFLKAEKPEVICLQEVLEDDFPFLKKELEMEGIYQPWSYTRNYKESIGKKQGVAIFSKNIVDSGHIFYFGKEENILKSFDECMSNKDFRKNNALVWARIKNSDDQSYEFITTHLPVTCQGESSPYQLEVTDALLEKLKTFNEFVLCGDMNAPRGNETFKRLARSYKDNIPLKYKTSIDQNLHRTKGIQFMVDGLFTTPGYQASKVKLIDGVSDHMAIVAEIKKD